MRLLWFLNEVSEIDKTGNVKPQWLNLGDIKPENLEWLRQMELIKSCLEDELILLDTLYYTGQFLKGSQLNIPLNPNDAKKDVI